MRSLREDLQQDLDKVERVWIRRPAAIIIYPIGLIVCVLVAAAKEAKDATYYFFKRCW